MWGKTWGIMATARFRIKTQNELNTIYFRLRIGRTNDFEISLDDFKCPKDRWSNSKQQILPTDIVDYRSINLTLDKLQNYIINLVNNDFDSKIKYSTKWFRLEVFTFLNKQDKIEEDVHKIYVLNFFEYYKDKVLPQEKAKDGVNMLSVQTKKNFSSAFSKYEKFENVHSKTKFKLKELDDEILEDYKQFLFKTENLSVETTNKYIKTFLSVLEYGKKIGVFKNELNFNKIPKPKDIDNAPYLNFEEIDRIMKVDLRGYLDNARDWLVIGCETGLRVSDLLNLNSSRIQDEEYIKIVTTKTRETVVIPISKRVKEILLKNNGFPRKISSQKFNEYIKKVCLKAEITQVIKGEKLTDFKLSDGSIIKRKIGGEFPKYKLISSHTCRRSFATNWYKTGTIPNHVIMAITGHKTESVFMNYIKMTNQEKVDEFRAAMINHGR